MDQNKREHLEVTRAFVSVLVGNLSATMKRNLCRVLGLLFQCLKSKDKECTWRRHMDLFDDDNLATASFVT